LEITPTLPSDVRVEGRIVFSGAGWLSPSYLLDMMTGDKIILNEEKDDVIGYMNVSPDGKWLAYRHDKFHPASSQLIITASDGQPLQNIPWDSSWGQISGWLDDERLWISRKRGSDPYSINDVLIVLNPFTRRQQELPVDYPGFVNVYSGPGWGAFNLSATVYDPTLRRVLYPGGFSKLILWDVQTNREIAVVAGTISLNMTPRWSPDGQHFLISGPATLMTSQPQDDSGTERMELFGVSRDGEIKQLTHLADLYTEVNFGRYAWSPDGRYVAFGVRLQPNIYPDLYPMSKSTNAYRFAILDTVTQEVTNYCVPNTTPAEPVWSPDSRQVVIEDNQSISENNVFVIDITQNIAVNLAENATPVGWMKASP
jgi:hypothetical protein